MRGRTDRVRGGVGDDGREGDVRGGRREKRGREEGKEGAGGEKKRRGREFCAREALTAPRREEGDRGGGGGGEGEIRGREGEKPTPLSTPSNIGGQWEKADSFNCTL